MAVFFHVCVFQFGLLIPAPLLRHNGRFVLQFVHELMTGVTYHVTVPCFIVERIHLKLCDFSQFRNRALPGLLGLTG